MISQFNRRTLIAWVALVAITAMPFSALAQTQIKYHSNKYSAQDDVKLGRQAAQEAEGQFPLLRDETVRSYVENVGRRLVGAIPSEFQHPEFQSHQRARHQRLCVTRWSNVRKSRHDRSGAQ
jgi:predicted Zn-dependent protease